ncbi:hypothetical protein ACWDV7_14575 [Streptomyces sp. NPDC003362]
MFLKRLLVSGFVGYGTVALAPSGHLELQWPAPEGSLPVPLIAKDDAPYRTGHDLYTMRDSVSDFLNNSKDRSHG